MSVFPGSAQSTLLQPVVWLTIALATVICIVPVLAFRFLKLDLKPQLSDTVNTEHMTHIYIYTHAYTYTLYKYLDPHIHTLTYIHAEVCVCVFTECMSLPSCPLKHYSQF